MRISCAMIASRVTPPIKEQGTEVDGAEEARGVVVSVRDRFGRSWASLHLTVAASMTHIIEKCGD